ncbi:MAG: hypothetical protein AAGE59_09220 [Cyanobacteria bacterium P01_F01_bin.86]
MTILQDFPLTISDVYVNTIATGKVTRGHRCVLKDAIFSLGLEEDELTAIDRLIWSIGRGRLQIVDD